MLVRTREYRSTVIVIVLGPSDSLTYLESMPVTKQRVAGKATGKKMGKLFK
jgi:hypothetical protein